MTRIALKRARDEARDALRAMIIEGVFPPDGRVEEIAVSDRLGVSRTPLREALIALEEEGLVTSRPHRGFVVVQPDARLVTESFPILGALEAQAVRLGGDRLRAALPELRALNAALEAEPDKARRYELDRTFHAALAGPCGNDRLLRLLDHEQARARFFDGAQERGIARHQGSVSDHEAILLAIGRGDIDGAARAVSWHWENGLRVVLRWLEDRGTGAET